MDFESAKALWNDGAFVEGPTVSPDEDRWMRVAKFEGKLWSAIFTIRDERVRLISVRRARPKEVLAYDNQDDHG